MTIFIYSTFPNKNEAKKIGEKLIQKKLAACVNVFPVEAMYSWRRRTAKNIEFAMLIKTRRNNFKKVEKFILKNHSYENPCILEIPIGRVTKKYLSWLNRSL